MKVIKRDKRIVDFDKDKIKNAIIKAMNDSKHVDIEVDENIAKEIRQLEKDFI